MAKQLKEWAQSERYDWPDNCSCHLSPPCYSCMHPGNPLNQEQDPECWEEAFDLDEMVTHAKAKLALELDRHVNQHLFLMDLIDASNFYKNHSVIEQRLKALP